MTLPVTTCLVVDAADAHPDPGGLIIALVPEIRRKDRSEGKNRALVTSFTSEEDGPFTYREEKGLWWID
jgi:hypothetical protein